MDTELSRAPAAWPALVSLATVVMLSIIALSVDLLAERQTSERIDDLVGNALRSVALVDDLRARTHALASATRDERSVGDIAARIEADAREYEPLASYPGEHDEWRHLQQLLGELKARRLADITPIEESMDRLIAINEHEAADRVAAIRGVHRSEIWLDAGELLITIALAAVVATLLRRVLRRQRALLSTHLALLEERQRELEAFAGRVAHDLRGPLSVQLGYAEMLRAQVPPAAQSIVGRMARATERMAATIDDLLALSNSGHPRPGETDVAPVMRELVDELALADCEVALELGGGTARCSAGILQQLVRNLVTNSLKYRAPTRRLELAISCAREDAMIRIDVRDNGVGMDAETAAHAFEPFYRAASTSGVAGHGLGLAIVKRTVDALGGTCLITSALDRGTTVTMRIPAADQSTRSSQL